MTQKTALKTVTDFLMTIALLFLMGYQFWGEAPHEWVGLGMFLLFIVHHILNINWHRNILKGKYSTIRVLMLSIDVLVLVSVIAQMYSGIVMSRYVFDFIQLSGSMTLARRLHILGAYWGFIFMSLHLGLHWKMILNMFRRASEIKNISKIRRAVAFILGLIAAGYGVFAFIKRDFPVYMLLKSEFVFMDYSEIEILFYIDCLAIMGLCILTAHSIAKLAVKYKRKSKIL